jgi:signal peptidase I
VLTSGDLITAVRASACFPGAFEPVIHLGRTLADGGICNNLPVDALATLNADVTIASDVTPPRRAAYHAPPDDPRPWWERVVATVTLEQRTPMAAVTLRSTDIMMRLLTDASTSTTPPTCASRTSCRPSGSSRSGNSRRWSPPARPRPSGPGRERRLAPATDAASGRARRGRYTDAHARTTLAPRAALPPRTPRHAPPRFWREVRGYAEALVIAYLVVTFVFNTVGVVGSSMRPNLDGGVGSSNVLQSLLTGDRVFIPKYETWLRRMGVLGGYERGDIVVVRDPANSPTAIETGSRPFFIKRVIAVPGDRLRIEAGQVIVNGHRVDQGFITEGGEIVPDPQDFPLDRAAQRHGRGVGRPLRHHPEGTAFPDLPLADGGALPALPVGDPRVQLYYGTTLDALAPMPPDAPEGVPFVHDIVIPPVTTGSWATIGSEPGAAARTRACSGPSAASPSRARRPRHLAAAA